MNPQQQMLLTIDMWEEINSLHLSYLQTEECLKKIKEQTRLEEVIKRYLSLVPHNNKFWCTEILYVLHNSLRNKKDFSPSKAISAWSALAKYAHNILTQPWRKEFYAIQKYGGFFSYVIKDVLIDWEIVFGLMGYTTSRDTMILTKPIDPDKLTCVARDCVIAQVECQIMVKIYGEVLKMHSECTWQDVLQFRENHICSTEDAISGLNAIFMQRQKEEYIHNSYTPSAPHFAHTSHPPIHNSSCMRYFPTPLTHFPAFPNTTVNMQPHPKLLLDKCDFMQPLPEDYNYPNCTKHVSPQNIVHLNDNSFPSQLYPDASCGMQYSADKNMCPQYIYSNNPQYGIDIVERDHCSNCHGLNYGSMYPYTYSNNKYIDHSFDYHRHRIKPLGKYENPTKQHFSDNQLSQRNNKDIYFPSSTPKLAPVNVTDVENAMKAFTLDFDKNTISDNESEKTILNKTVCDSKKVLISETNKLERKRSSEELWECQNCTYHNSLKKSICELCAKSKDVGNEKQPLICGGRECHKCTLVNEKDATMCSACGESLENSSTYI